MSPPPPLAFVLLHCLEINRVKSPPHNPPICGFFLFTETSRDVRFTAVRAKYNSVTSQNFGLSSLSSTDCLTCNPRLNGEHFSPHCVFHPLPSGGCPSIIMGALALDIQLLQ